MTVRQHRLSTVPYESEYVYPSDKDYPLNEDWEAGPRALLNTEFGLYDQAWHLTYNPNPPPAYDPAMQRFDGTTGYYNLVADISMAAGFTVVGRFIWRGGTITAAGGFNRCLWQSLGAADIKIQVAIVNDETGDPTTAGKLAVLSRSAVGADLLRIFSNTTVSDGQEYIFFCSYDPVGGTAILRINSLEEINTGATGHTITTGTIDTGSGDNAVGARTVADRFFDGDIGYLGMRGAYLTNWSDFMDGSDPQQLNEIVWTQWGGQPAFWKDTGAMDASIGTEGVMTKNGTITEIPPPGGFQSFTVTPEDVGDPVVVLSGINSVQCSLAFDQNAHVTIAWVDSFNQGHLYWYDTTVGDWIITDFQNPVAGLALTLDDKRPRQTGASDILLWYTIPDGGVHKLYTREQRDRFATPYLMTDDPVWPYFKKLGMAKELRVQLSMTNTGPV